MNHWKRHLLLALAIMGFSTGLDARAGDTLFMADFDSPDQDAEIQGSSQSLVASIR